MKHLQSVVLILLPAVGVGLWWQGQQPPATPATPQPIPPAKVAVIDSRFFQNDNGLQQLVQQMKQLNDKLKPRVDELTKLQTEIQALQDEINTKSANWTVQVLQQRREVLERKKTDEQRLREDLEGDYQRERRKVLEPIGERVETLLKQYAAKRGITMIMDLAPLEQSGAVPYWDQTIDVTQDFIAEYNKANPVAR